MAYRLISRSTARLAVFVMVLLLLQSCANEVAPTGGKRDSTPPKVKYAYPADKSLNFNSKRIKIRFNEFIVQTLNPQEILVSPPMETSPKMTVSGKNLYISLRSKPKENTTYTINFGDAVKDNNENNVLKNFTYVFATGSKLDTARVIGTVLNAADKDLDNIIVGLYPIDSVDGVQRAKPYYFAKTDKAGSFAINNIHADSYRVYLLRDQNLNYIYDQPNELVGFQEQPITLADSSREKLDLVVFLPRNRQPKLLDALQQGIGKLQLTYSGPINTLALNSDVFTPGDRVDISPTKDTFTYWYGAIYAPKMILTTIANDSLRDTTRISLNPLYKDSTTNERKHALSIENQAAVSSKADKPTLNRSTLSPYMPIIIPLSRPVDSVNAAKRLILVNDSTHKTDTIAIVLDPKTKRSFSYSHQHTELINYSLTIPDSALLDHWGWWNRAITFHYTADGKENYGNIILSLKFEHPEKYYIFKILNTDNQPIQTFYYVGNKEKKLTLKNVKAGSYHLEAIEDSNRNGEWDSGDFKLKTQPEKIIKFKESYDLKGNWDLEIEVKL